MRTREAEIARLRAELDDLLEPVQEKLAVMPTWVRQQLEDTASLLAEAPERTKREFMRLGVSFTLHRCTSTANDRSSVPRARRRLRS